MNHYLTALIYRVRLWKGYSESNTFFKYTYMDGANSNYLNLKDYNPVSITRIVFDFTLNDVSYSSISLLSTGYFNIEYIYSNYSWSFTNGSFVNDYKICGEDGAWIPFPG
jgi:hypothetical protein